MLGRTLIKVYAGEGFFSLKTISKEFGASKSFYIQDSDWKKLMEWGHVIVSDICSFAEMHLCPGKNDGKTVKITFSWLRNQGFDRLAGRTETVRLPCEKLIQCIEASRSRGGNSQPLLSLKQNQRATITFHSRKNLVQVAGRKNLRRKLGKFLDRHFNWYGTKNIRVVDDFCPYSFFFTEECLSGPGICGGVILHGQEDMKTAHYEIHT